MSDADMLSSFRLKSASSAVQLMDELSSSAIFQESTESNIDQPKLTLSFGALKAMKLGSQEMTEIELGEINTVNNSLNPMSDSTCLTKPSSSNRRFNATTCSFPSQKYSSEHDVLGNLMHSKLNSKSKIQKKKPKIISNTNSLKLIFTE